MCEWEHYCDEASSHHLLIPSAFWIVQIVSVEECLNLTQNLMQIRCSIHSVILTVTATQYLRSFKSIYGPHWLVQCSCHCSHMRILFYSPWRPGYIDVTQTVLIILTMVGLFQTDLIRVRVYLWLLYTILLFCKHILCQTHCCDYCSFVVSFEIRKYKSSAVGFF